MGRKLKGKSIQSKGLKGALIRHQTKEQTQAKLLKNAEISNENKLNKIKSMKTPKKSKQNNKLHGNKGISKGLMPFLNEDKVLLIGEGDFTFAKSLILQNYLIPENLIATSFDSYEELILKYPNVDEVLKELKEFGVKIIHQVDATNLPLTLKLIQNSKQKKANKKLKLFDEDTNRNSNDGLNYIMFNFPHTGKGIKDQDRNIRDHQKLILEYFKNCKQVFELINSNNDLQGYNTIQGKIIISLFEGEPYHSWGIKILGKSQGYKVERSGRFDWSMFPEYHHRRTNSTKDTTKPASERDARIYIFEEWINNNKDDEDKDEE
ncbi:25S rRNA (uridine(2634)-N(3))-methyltransferase [Candida tropicalis]